MKDKPRRNEAIASMGECQRQHCECLDEATRNLQLQQMMI